MVTDSIQMAGDADETQLPCSPASIMQTDVAAKTLELTMQHEATRVGAGNTPQDTKAWKNICFFSKRTL